MTRLQNEIEEKTQLITSLQESLAKRDVRIAELDEAVTNLTGQVEHLTTENEQQKEVLMTQDEALNTVYYALGTNKELKEQKIVEGGGLFSSKKVMEGEFNKNYFTAVDMRKLHDIPFDSKKAKLLTNHPEGTYELQKDNEGYLTLVITNPDSFWSLSRYLVVELNESHSPDEARGIASGLVGCPHLNTLSYTHDPLPARPAGSATVHLVRQFF